MRIVYWTIFFFQAEDGIRDSSVTGVQTCALPISPVKERDPLLNGTRHVGECVPAVHRNCERGVGLYSQRVQVIEHLPSPVETLPVADKDGDPVLGRYRVVLARLKTSCELRFAIYRNYLRVKGNLQVSASM